MKSNRETHRWSLYVSGLYTTLYQVYNAGALSPTEEQVATWFRHASQLVLISAIELRQSRTRDAIFSRHFLQITAVLTIVSLYVSTSTCL